MSSLKRVSFFLPCAERRIEGLKSGVEEAKDSIWMSEKAF
jgi:hypothetical protein